MNESLRNKLLNACENCVFQELKTIARKCIARLSEDDCKVVCRELKLIDDNDYDDNDYDNYAAFW